MSHTVTVDIKCKNKEGITKAAQTMGAHIIGEGTHRLFGSTETGLGIKLNGWSYPIVIKNDGTVAFDNYGGRWGDIKDLDMLKELYATEVVKAECENQGWYYEQNSNTLELTINHPDGGIITVKKDGTIEAANFVGSSCETATQKLEEVMGTTTSQERKQEYNLTHTNVTQSE